MEWNKDDDKNLQMAVQKILQAIYDHQVQNGNSGTAAQMVELKMGQLKREVEQSLKYHLMGSNSLRSGDAATVIMQFLSNQRGCLPKETADNLWDRLEADPAYVYRLMLMAYSAFQIEE